MNTVYLFKSSGVWHVIIYEYPYGYLNCVCYLSCAVNSTIVWTLDGQMLSAIQFE